LFLLPSYSLIVIFKDKPSYTIVALHLCIYSALIVNTIQYRHFAWSDNTSNMCLWIVQFCYKCSTYTPFSMPPISCNRDQCL